MSERVSLICTVLNEETNISNFIKSIVYQTRKPDEFIIVDGGSSDRTYPLLKACSKAHKWIKVFRLVGANISKGRNYAIKKSKNETLISADAGTEYEKTWVEELTKHFRGGLGFGKTLPLAENNFQKVLAKQLKQRYGSARNAIFRKSLWQKVGGYPEDLDIAEDTVFNKKMERVGVQIDKIPSAIGYWNMRRNLREVKRQFYNYGKWSKIAQRKYDILPLGYRVQIKILTTLLPLYPLMNKLSLINLSLKIFINRKFEYLRGYRGA